MPFGIIGIVIMRQHWTKIHDWCEREEKEAEEEEREEKSNVSEPHLHFWHMMRTKSQTRHISQEEQIQFIPACTRNTQTVLFLMMRAILSPSLSPSLCLCQHRPRPFVFYTVCVSTSMTILRLCRHATGAFLRRSQNSFQKHSDYCKNLLSNTFL